MTGASLQHSACSPLGRAWLRQASSTACLAKVSKECNRGSNLSPPLINVKYRLWTVLLQLQLPASRGPRGWGSPMQRSSFRAQHGEDSLPDQVLVSILELLIPRHASFTSAALINKRWLRVATSKDLWASKMAPALSECCMRVAAKAALSWGSLYFAIYHTNLLSNPYFKPPMLPLEQPAIVPPGIWAISAQGGSGWSWESQPVMGSPSSSQPTDEVDGGLSPVPIPCPPFRESEGDMAVGGAAYAMASSYRFCEVVQVVDLQAELVRRGLSTEAAAAFLDSSPPLCFSVWYAARADCPAECEARALLTDASSYFPVLSGAPPAAQALPAHLSNSAARLWSWTTGVVQPGRGSWHRATVQLVGYPAGARRAVVVLRGRDLRYWAGHFGAKLAAPSLRFLAPDELDEA